MKRILLLTLVIAITMAFAFTAVQAPIAGVGVAYPNAGVNTRGYMHSFWDASVQPVAVLVRPPVTPNVGWNS